jgi:hypothetical protein
LIGDRDYSALEFGGEARRRLEVAFKLILLRRAPRIVGEAEKYGKTVGERREKRVSRFKISVIVARIVSTSAFGMPNPMNWL